MDDPELVRKFLSALKLMGMGDEEEGWKAKRDAKERQALEEGKGYGDLITDQIWEVWNWGKSKTGETTEKNEPVLGGKVEKEEKR